MFSLRSGLLLFRLVGQLLEDRIGLHFLLDEVAQLEQGRLQDEQTLLKLRGKDLLQRKILRLVHSLAGHVRVYRLRRRRASNLRAVQADPGLLIGKISTAEHDLLFNWLTRHFSNEAHLLGSLVDSSRSVFPPRKRPTQKTKVHRSWALAKDLQTPAISTRKPNQDRDKLQSWPRPFDGANFSSRSK